MRHKNVRGSQLSDAALGGTLREILTIILETKPEEAPASIEGVYSFLPTSPGPSSASDPPMVLTG